MSLPPVLALDGPSGSGKGTIGQLCAHEFGWHYLDSGAIYRALAWSALKNSVDNNDIRGLTDLADKMQLGFEIRLGDVAKIIVNDVDATDQLRTEETGEMASKIAPIKEVRAALLKLQQRSRQAPGLVADGRDMGTVVFPDAQYKIFLTASVEIRAQRRFDQLKSKGFNVNLARLKESIHSRDVRDSNREASPLKAADDALSIDTSNLTIEEVVTLIKDYVKQR
ncbi:MAG TPA: (d)CMP kinase [Gammaproteobacteria bacterium]|nr:(d)CMP kinase [Gammaproteobacteria bacterium]